MLCVYVMHLEEGVALGLGRLELLDHLEHFHALTKHKKRKENI